MTFSGVHPKRSALMSRIKSKNTKPEMVVRRALHSIGFRYRLHRQDLPGKPDIVLQRYKVVIFVHGCFWHQHKGCKLASSPKSRRHYWLPKLAANVARDRQHVEELEGLGWKCETIWECEARAPDLLWAWVYGLERRLRSNS